MSTRISALPVVVSANVVDTDILPIVTGIAANAAVTKRIAVSELRLKLGTTAPAGGRTVTSAATYLANNAVFNVKDFGAFGDGVTDDTAAIQLAMNTAGARNMVLFPAGNYKISSLLYIKNSGQWIYGQGATITTVGISTSVFHIGNNGSGVFVKTDDVTIQGFVGVGAADGSNGIAFFIGVMPPTANPYVEGGGCSNVRIKQNRASGFVFGVAATAADNMIVEDNRFGGMKYCASCGAGGYGVLLQTCFEVQITHNRFVSVAGDRHAMYISADPGRAFDNNNICKGVIIDHNLVDWRQVNGPTFFEACLEIRSTVDIVVDANIFKGGYGAIDYEAQQGNGTAVIFSNNVFDGQFSNASTRACIAVTRSSGTYVNDSIIINGNTFQPTGANTYAVSLFTVNNISIVNNIGKLSGGALNLVVLNGNVVGMVTGNNEWTNTGGSSYVIAGTGNSDILFNRDLHIGGGTKYNWLTYPVRTTFGYARTALISANSTASPVITSDPDGIIASLVNDPNGLKPTFQNNVDTPSTQKVQIFSTGSGVAYCFIGSVTGQAAVIAALNQAGAVLPGASNSYSLAVVVQN